MTTTRMTPHRWRRALQLVNLALGGLLVASGVLLFGSEEEAEARVGREVRASYERSRLSGLRWTPVQPVTQGAMREVVWRFRAHAPAHWPLSGPLPPRPEKHATVGAVPTAQPGLLQALGHVTMVAHDPATGSAIGFHFDESDKDRGFSPGEIIRAAEADPARFRLKAVRAVRSGLFDVEYDVLGADGVAATETLRVDARDEADSEGGCIGPLPGVAGVEPEAKGPEAKAPEAKLPEARLVMTGARAQLRALQPKTHVNPKNARDRVIEFDAKTYRWARGRGTAALTELVKTAVAVDPAGRRIGIRITGMAKGLPADAFDIRRGDILVSINDQPVASPDDAIRIAKTLDPDSEKLVKVVVDRNGRLFTYRVDARDPQVKRKITYFTWK